MANMKVPTAPAGKASEPGRVKTIIRLKHSLPEGTEIHAVLPDTVAEFEAAFNKTVTREAGQ
jgi:hypothetical protein